MSLGIDLGNDYMVVTAVRQGVDVLQNDIGKRKTRMAVTYNADNREIGDDAFSQYLSKFNMSAMYFKRLLGKQYGLDDEDIEKEKRFLPNKFTEPAADGSPSSIKYVIPRVGELPPEQALATMLLKAKQIYESNSENQPVQECVITVPTSWNNAQRLAMMHAADMANLKVLELANETTCILYQYGLQRDITDTRIVMFYDIGATTTSCTLARITKETAEVLAFESNPHLGGRDFIECIVEEVVKFCKEKKNIVVEPNSKAWLKIRRACEKTFHTLSANHQASCSVENVLDGVDISVPYTRESFYAVLEPRFKDAILEPINKIITQYPQLLKDGKLQVNAFEIIGGVTRVPLVQQLLVDNFGVVLSKTLDADEAIARGAALRCAALSTTKRINRKFAVIDKKVVVELFLNKAPADAKEGDSLEKYVVPAEDVILTKSFHAAYPSTYPQPRLLSLKFQQVQLPVMVGVRMNGSQHDNVRSLILPQSKVDGRLFSESAEGNTPTDIKVSLSLNSSGYLNVYHVETVPQKAAVAAPAPIPATPVADEPATPTMTDAPVIPAPEAEAKPEAAAAATEGEEKKADAPTMTDAPAPAEGEGEEKKDEPASPIPQLEAPHEPTPHSQPMEDAPAVPSSPTPTQQKPIPLVTYNQTLGALNNADLTAARESEAKLQERDAITAKRQEVYNNLESHLFTTRSRLADSADLPDFMTKDDAAKALSEIKKILEWLDDEGYDAELDVLEKKLIDAQQFTHDANVRLHNWKNLASSNFAFAATIDAVIAHKFIGVEKFAKHIPELQSLEEQARKILESGDKLNNNLAVNSQTIDTKNSQLRHMIHYMDKYDPERERIEEERRQQENLRQAAEEEQRKAAMEAQQAVAAAAAQQQQQAAQQAAATEEAENENAAPSCEQPTEPTTQMGDDEDNTPAAQTEPPQPTESSSEPQPVEAPAAEATETEAQTEAQTQSTPAETSATAETETPSETMTDA